MTRAFGVDKENKNGERIVGFVLRGMCVCYEHLLPSQVDCTWSVFWRNMEWSIQKLYFGEK